MSCPATTVSTFWAPAHMAYPMLKQAMTKQYVCGRPQTSASLAMKGGATPRTTALTTPIVPMMVCSPNEDVAKEASTL